MNISANGRQAHLRPIDPARHPKSRLRAPLVGFLMVFALAGCKQHLNTSSVPSDGYRTRHPIIISELPVNLDVPVGMRGGRVSAATRQTVISFARDAQARGNGRIHMMVPSGSANESAALRTSNRLHRYMITSGVAPTLISRHAYKVDDARDAAPVRLTYYRIKAAVRPCRNWPDNLTSRSSNDGYYNFGCATQSNLASMVANPTDLLYPRGSSPSDPTRRGVVFDKYRRGESTATKYPKNDTGTVSDVAGE